MRSGLDAGFGGGCNELRVESYWLAAAGAFRRTERGLRVRIWATREVI
jgi:hypothetical protein